MATPWYKNTATEPTVIDVDWANTDQSFNTRTGYTAASSTSVSYDESSKAKEPDDTEEPKETEKCQGFVELQKAILRVLAKLLNY